MRKELQNLTWEVDMHEIGRQSGSSPEPFPGLGKNWDRRGNVCLGDGVPADSKTTVACQLSGLPGKSASASE